MTHLQLGAVLQHLRRAATRKQEDELSDGQLLELFARQRDESAFAALLRRHGPMVLGVCRGILRQLHDVEDAFQATFLILAQKAACIRRGESVGGWLYEVASNVALKVRSRAARQQGCEKEVPNRTQTDPLDDLTVRELRQALHEELRQLPEKFRTPLILCYLEGKTQEEAARQLGWPKRRVKDRLQRGREQLRRRLLKRGLAPVATLGTALFAVDGVSAAVMATLAGATVRAAVSGTASAAIAALMEAGGAFVSVSKAKMAMVFLLAMSLLGGAGVWWKGDFKTRSGGLTPPESQSARGADALRSTKHETNKVEIHGRVLDPDGKPKAGAKLLLLTSKGKLTPLGVSADDGRFTVAVPKETTKHWDHSLVAQAEGTGIDFLDLYEFKNKQPTELRLVKDNAIRGRVVNTEGKPVRGVRVAGEDIRVYRNNSLDTFRDAWNKLWAGGAGSGELKHIYSGADALFATATDTDGRFVLRGMGAERTIRLRLRGAGIADTSVWIGNRDGFDPKPYNQAIFDHVEKRHHMNYRWSILSGPDVIVVAETEKVIRGVVTDADTGKGVAGVMVRLTRDSDELVHYPPEAKTDAQGHFEIHGVRKTKRYLLAVDDNKDTGHMPSQVWAEDTVAHQPIRADIKVKKGVIVTGKLIDGATGEALPGSIMAAVLRGNPFARDYPKFDEFGILAQCDSYDRTDSDHAFRVVAIPGPILLMGKTEGTDRAVYKYVGSDPKYPQFFTENGDGYLGYNRMAPLQGIWNKVLEIKPGVAVVKKDIVLEREKILAEVQVQDVDGKPLLNVWADTDDPKRGVSFEPHGGRKESSSCSVYGEASDKPLRIVFYQGGRKLTSTLILKGDEKQTVIVKLGPASAIKGRLLDAGGKPLADMEVELRYRDRAAEYIHIYAIRHNEERGPILTDAKGAFVFDDVIPETAFELSFWHSKRRSKFQATTAIPVIEVRPGECSDLGTIQLKPVPEKPEE